jgi:hypothetical protein
MTSSRRKLSIANSRYDFRSGWKVVVEYLLISVSSSAVKPPRTPSAGDDVRHSVHFIPIQRPGLMLLSSKGAIAKRGVMREPSLTSLESATMSECTRIRRSQSGIRSDVTSNSAWSSWHSAFDATIGRDRKFSSARSRSYLAMLCPSKRATPMWSKRATPMWGTLYFCWRVQANDRIIPLSHWHRMNHSPPYQALRHH